MPRLAPGPRANPLIGHLPLATSSHIAGEWQRLHLDWGDTFSLRFGPPLIGRRLTVTRTPEAIGQILGARSPFTKTGHPFFEAFRDVLGTGLFSAYGEDWRFQRRVLSPLFTAKQSAAYAPLVRRRAEEAVARWIAAERPLSLRSEVLRLTLVIVTDLLFGAGRDDLADRLERHFQTVSAYIIERAFGPLVLPRRTPLPHIRRQERAVREVYALVDEVLAGATADEDSFIGRLRLAEDPDTGRRVTDAEIRDQVLVFVAAGHDTTATALTMALQLLGMHPEVQSDAADEVAALGPVETAEDAQRLRLTTAVMDETMRLYPSAPGTGRRAAEDAVVDGWDVPAGTMAYTNFWSLHRHPDLYPHPEAFRPQRFVDVPATDRPRHTYLPFGAGPRSCIGAHTAVLEMQLILATVLARAEVVALTRDTPVRSDITLTPSVPLPVRFRRR
ncbi:cytochrome P450 [Euzebya sp.]|uniref:cytochrome P450 n=1 Tax=Euzebya sp. TaxID=1971409 RepID=UPI003510E850